MGRRGRPELRERNDRIRTQVASGLTYEEVALVFGITRQRVDHIVHPEKKRARDLTRLAIESGALKRPDRCPRCGGGGLVEAHHPDYAKPDLVVWRCRRCHRAEHAGHRRRRVTPTGLIGRRGLATLPEAKTMRVAVLVRDARVCWGRTDLLVEPIGGHGPRWVRRTSVEVTP